MAARVTWSWQSLDDIDAIELAALTAEEARYLIGFRTADELRGRALAAVQARIERLRAKGVHVEREMMGYILDRPGSGPETV